MSSRRETSVNRDQVNIVIVGLSGQGIVMFGKLLSSVFAHAEHKVTTFDVLGTAHRGTQVYSQIRISRAANISNLIPTGAADVVVGMEPLETLRAGAYYLADGGWAIYNTHKIIPMYASIGRDFTSDKPRPLGYPSLEFIKKTFEEDMGATTIPLDATAMAEEAGHSAAANTVLLGAMLRTGLVPASKESVLGAIEQLVPAGTAGLNQRAFEMGYTYQPAAAARVG